MREITVRWGLDRLAELLELARVTRPYLVASARWSHLPIEAVGAWHTVPTDRFAQIAEDARAADGLLAIGGGSAIDLAKGVSALTRLPVIAVPTTYAGAEWTPAFAIRDESRRAVSGGLGGQMAGVLYVPELTFDLALDVTCGSALNALAHCAEALFVRPRDAPSEDHAIRGARAIGRALPRVMTSPRDRDARVELLEGAMHGGRAIAGAGFGLAHAMAQVVGGRYGLPHGAVNARCLPATIRFTRRAAGPELARLDAALEVEDSAAWCDHLAEIAGIPRLGALGVPRADLPALASDIAGRPALAAHPCSASPAEILELLVGVW